MHRSRLLALVLVAAFATPAMTATTHAATAGDTDKVASWVDQATTSNVGTPAAEKLQKKKDPKKKK